MSVVYDGLSVVTEGGESIFDFAGADSEGEPWWERVRADAQLCAAAPDMYEALKLIGDIANCADHMRPIEECLQDLGCVRGWQVYGQFVEVNELRRVRAALAKAEGKS